MKRAETPALQSRRDHVEGFVPPGEHRKRVNVSLEQISESTKISRRFLEAIERGEYAELPGGVFTVSYIRQYAEATGYDAERLLEDWRRKTGQAIEPATEFETKRPAPSWLRSLTLGLF